MSIIHFKTMVLSSHYISNWRQYRLVWFIPLLWSAKQTLRLWKKKKTQKETMSVSYVYKKNKTKIKKLFYWSFRSYYFVSSIFFFLFVYKISINIGILNVFILFFCFRTCLRLLLMCIFFFVFCFLYKKKTRKIVLSLINFPFSY